MNGARAASLQQARLLALRSRSFLRALRVHSENLYKSIQPG